jgi:hypothetical protein
MESTEKPIRKRNFQALQEALAGLEFVRSEDSLS